MQKIVGVGLSWYPNDWIRFYMQFQYVNVDKLNSAGTTQVFQEILMLIAQLRAPPAPA